jgi:hypothetical protein
MTKDSGSLVTLSPSPPPPLTAVSKPHNLSNKPEKSEEEDEKLIFFSPFRNSMVWVGYAVSQLFGLTTTIANPILYTSLNESFREAAPACCTRILCCRLCWRGTRGPRGDGGSARGRLGGSGGGRGRRGVGVGRPEEMQANATSAATAAPPEGNGAGSR